MDDFLREFLTESGESLAMLDSELVKLEQNPGDPALLGSIFRLVHTIKGTCGFLDLPRLERIAHAAENVLGKIRDGALPVTPAAISAVLQALDRIRSLLAALEQIGSEPAGDDATLISLLDDIAAGGAGIAAAALAPHAGTMAETSESAAAPGAEDVAAAQTIRVNVDLLANLTALAGELVLARNQLAQQVGGDAESPFALPLQRLGHLTSELHEQVMQTRLQPIGHAWAKLPRLVRDLGVELGKQIELRLSGADTKLDRQVLELIKDPLTHLVRNAADHGLEGTDERRAAGKCDAGRIELSARHEGGHVVVRIGDDGRGLPYDAIRRRAVASGLCAESELAGWTDQQVAQLIFRPGLSTAGVVTSVSGRGVGMDVVKTNIERIGGSIALASEPGSGTQVTIKIPLTLAILQALIVGCGGERFAIPQLKVAELVRVTARSASRIEHINGTPLLWLRERLLPLVSLRPLLAIGDGEPVADASVVIARVGSQSFGIIVDRVFDTEEIVVKPTAPMLRQIGMFSGATILGDGRVVMILDPNALAASIGVTDTAGAAASESAAASPGSDGDSSALLVFRTAGAGRLAVPLAAVARLEEIPVDSIETAGGRPMVRYRGGLMPLLCLDETAGMRTGGVQPTLVFTDGGRWVGLVVDQIIDIVEDRVLVDVATRRPGLVGCAVIGGKVTEIVDAGYYLQQVFPDWAMVPVEGADRSRDAAIERSAA